MNNQNDRDFPLVGRDIRWDLIEGSFWKIEHFSALAKIESGRIVELVKNFPYALLTVSLSMGLVELPEKVYIPVLHKLDFNSLWTVFEERGITSQEEAHVVYMPLKQKKVVGLFHRSLPSLHISVFPFGSIKKWNDFLKGTIPERVTMPDEIFFADARPRELM